MTTIKASCPVCGDVELTPDQMRLVVCSKADWSYYAFDCPGCADEVSRGADDEVVRLLISGGVRAETWHVPDEVFEVRDGAPLSYDELLDFALWLRENDRLTTGLSSQDA
ncbi:MAG: hypothetical protein ACRDYU_19620 [Actinomycetes bacterium]